MSEARNTSWRGQVRKEKKHARAQAAEVILENGGPSLVNIKQSMQHLSGSVSEDDIATLVRQLGYVPTNLVAIAARGTSLRFKILIRLPVAARPVPGLPGTNLQICRVAVL